MTDQPDAYGRVVGDGQQTVSLAGAVVDLFRGPVNSLWQRRTLLQSLRADLGEWADEAVDEKGNFLQPVLRAAAFEEHLVSNNAHFKPRGACTSILGWAQLLYAIDIRPGQGIVAWRRPARAKDPLTTGQFDLEVDGEVLCHIINLYRLYDGRFARSTDSEAYHLLKEGCKLPFGRLDLSKESLNHVATFQSTTPADLSQARQSFCCKWQHTLGYLAFEPLVVVTRYLNAIHHSVSESKAMLASPAAPLKEGAEAVIRAYRILHSTEEPYLLTDSWFQQANRVVRRITTNAGSDMTLIDDIITAFEDEPDIIKVARGEPSWIINSGNSPIILRENLRELISDSLNAAGYSFRLEWVACSVTLSDWKDVMIENIHLALEPLTKMVAGTWKYTLSQMPDEVAAILSMNKLWICPSAIILEFTPSSELWNADCLIRG